MKIIEEKSGDIPASELKDGQIAVITKWLNNDYVGLVVQRCDNNLVNLGRPYTECWSSAHSIPDTCRVRVLPAGTKLEI